MSMVQYGVWPNCCNNCDFCLLRNKEVLSKPKMLQQLDYIRKNITLIDWAGEFSHGISLLGGELFFTTDPEIQDSFILLIDDIIEKVLKVSQNPMCKFSTVTNGLYSPEFLFRVCDRIADTVGVHFLDVNFSYDLKYRYTTEERRLLVLENINKFHERYNYAVGVQMILTQYVIDMVNSGEFDIKDFKENIIPGGVLSFLYPHEPNTGKKLDDFKFKRKDFLEFIVKLKNEHYTTYWAFSESVKNSGVFKYTGMEDKKNPYDMPKLTDGKEIINEKCGHSTLYQCYADSDKCMYCDLLNIGK